jgi:hypothetical protein
MMDYKCKKEHYYGIGNEKYTCSHISEDIKKGLDHPCKNIRIRIYNVPGYITRDKEEQERFEYLPFCLDCVKNWELDDKVKIEYSPDLIDKSIQKYDLVEVCPICLKDYLEKNEVKGI